MVLLSCAEKLYECVISARLGIRVLDIGRYQTLHSFIPSIPFHDRNLFIPYYLNIFISNHLFVLLMNLSFSSPKFSFLFVYRYPQINMRILDIYSSRIHVPPTFFSQYIALV